MTLDTTLRKLHMQQALVRFFEDTDNRNVRDVQLLPGSDDYRDLWPATTWAALAEQALLERVGMPVLLAYKLTPFGWYTGWSLAGGIEQAGERARVTRLVQAMKEQIDGRKDHDPKVVAMAALADATGLPLGWVCNALHSTFVLWDFWGRNRVGPYPTRDNVDTIVIPPTFGHRHISYDELKSDRDDVVRREFE